MCYNVQLVILKRKYHLSAHCSDLAEESTGLQKFKNYGLK